MSPSAFQSLKALFAPTDEQLMWRVQTTGDSGAFGELVRRWEAPIQRLCARLTGDDHRAEDLAQEVFTRIFAQRAGFRQGGKFSTYLWRVALNHTYSELRRIQRRRETPLDGGEAGADADSFAAFPDEGPSPDEAVAARETGDGVRRALAQLPEEYRSVLVLRHYENLKFREIAAVLGLPEGTVKTRTTEALNALARLLHRHLDLPHRPSPNSRVRPTENLVP
jgi:RNA polymerase sigma-70 factor (ECF subfamily)